jgi:hypothetical protein
VKVVSERKDEVIKRGEDKVFQEYQRRRILNGNVVSECLRKSRECARSSEFDRNIGNRSDDSNGVGVIRRVSRMLETMRRERESFKSQV